MDGAVQVFALHALWKHLLYDSHHYKMAGHTGQRRMYGPIEKRFFWSQMANYIYTTVSNYKACAWNRASPELKRQLKLLPTSSSIEFVTIDNIEPLPCTANGKQYVIVMIDKYSELTRAMPTGKTSFIYVALCSLILGYSPTAFLSTSFIYSSTEEGEE